MILSNNIQLNNKKVVVLGYGGAARAIIFSLLNNYWGTALPMPFGLPQ